MYNFENVQSIDPKTCINFEFDTQRSNPNFKISQHKLANHNIWTIDNFLYPDECDQIIQKGEEAEFEFLEYRNLHRVLCFDQDESLIKTIQNRLEESDFLLTMNSNLWEKPQGFYSNGVNWKKNGRRINPCLRITRYENLNQFNWHRDSPYTNSELSKSNYTVIIYLNDDFEGGQTVFKVSSNNIHHTGLTIKEEEKLMKNVRETTIIPKKGTILIFPQCLMHMGSQVIGTKYILRTDLVCVGTKRNNWIPSELETRLYKLARKLFRQAQIYELYNDPRCDELYERCISLRQSPSLIKKYPEHLEKLIIAYKTDPVIHLNLNSSLTFEERTGTRYEYSYRSKNKFMMLKLATLFTLTFELNKITHENVNTLFGTLLEEMGIVYTVKKLVLPTKTNYFSEYYKDYDYPTNIDEETEFLSDSEKSISGEENNSDEEINPQKKYKLNRIKEENDKKQHVLDMLEMIANGEHKENEKYIELTNKLIEEKFPFNVFEEQDINEIYELYNKEHADINEMTNKFDYQQKHKRYSQYDKVTLQDIEKAKNDKKEVSKLKHYTLHEMFSDDMGKTMIDIYVENIVCNHLVRCASDKDYAKYYEKYINTQVGSILHLKTILELATGLNVSTDVKKKFLHNVLCGDTNCNCSRYEYPNDPYTIRHNWIKKEMEIQNKTEEEINDHDRWTMCISKYDVEYLKLQQRYEQFTRFMKQSLIKLPNDIKITNKQIHTEVNYEYNANPIDIKVTSNVITHSTDCEGCPLCDISCYSDAEANAFFYNTQFRTKFNDFEMLLVNVDINNHDTFTGTIKIVSPGNTFNHASCQCSDRTFKTKHQTYETTIGFESDVDFELYEDKIVIILDPVIVM
jgi:hypothetical protein